MTCRARKQQLQQLLSDRDPNFWNVLWESTNTVIDPSVCLSLSQLRKKAQQLGVPRTTSVVPLRVALLGGYTFHPLKDWLAHCLEAKGFSVELFIGEYDQYHSEILNSQSPLYAFQPDIVWWLPSDRRCRYTGALGDGASSVEKDVEKAIEEVRALCHQFGESSPAQLVLTNFVLPGRQDVGAYRSRTLSSEWSFKKAVNMGLGQKLPPSVHICDAEFLAYRMGSLAVEDVRSWFESKQIGSWAFQYALVNEFVHTVQQLKKARRKVLVLDLDNTLWGGVVGECGWEGIELGEATPRGEAFKAFQSYVRSLKDRGWLLAVCSKNDHKNVMEAFSKHPEMVLQAEDFVSIKANWKPKPENIKAIAEELNLGVDSFVFVDDTEAETAMVNMYLPAVATISLSTDPAEHTVRLQDSRLFECTQLTREDRLKTSLYKEEQKRQQLSKQLSNIGDFLKSLEMRAQIGAFQYGDVPRITQLINKSNQFNLTTVRRSETETKHLVGATDMVTLSCRLWDKFGEYGLISVIIGQVQNTTLCIDSWLMSCRVLQRQVETLLLNHLVAEAKRRGLDRIHGVYRPSGRNAMVQDLLPRLGFQSQAPNEYELFVKKYQPKPVTIQIEGSPYGSAENPRRSATSV